MTASLHSNLWFTLSRRPDIWTRLRKEVFSLEGAKPDLSSLKEMKYLQACLNECKSPFKNQFNTHVLI